jgi:Na+/H+-dicarboxylate symporter
MKIITEETYELNFTAIDEMSEYLESILSNYPYLARREILKTRLSMEEVLLKWNTLENQKVTLSIHEKRKCVEISLALLNTNYEFNPLDDELESIDSILASLGMGWMHQFDRGINTVYVRLTTKPDHKLRSIGISLLLAIITTAILRFGPQSTQDVFSNYIFTPCFTLCSNFLSAIVTPIMFFSIISGIISISNPHFLSTLGKDACISFVRGTIRIILIAAIVCAIIFPFDFNFHAEGLLLPFLNFLQESVPNNIFSPFIEENMMQVVFIAIVVGVALLFLQKQVKIIPDLVEECNVLLLKIISGFETIFPLFIYLSTVNVGLSANVHGFINFSKMFISFIVFIIIIMLFYFKHASKILNMRIKDIYKILKPSIDATLISSVGSASFSEAYDACEKDFKIDSKLVSFSLPIGTVIHKPFIASEFIFFMSAAMTSQGEVLNISTLFILVLLAFVLSIAYPPVSGGESSCYTVLLKQMGLPISMLALASSLSGILDFIETPTNVVSTELRLIISAKRLGRMKDPE